MKMKHFEWNKKKKNDVSGQKKRCIRPEMNSNLLPALRFTRWTRKLFVLLLPLIGTSLQKRNLIKAGLSRELAGAQQIQQERARFFSSEVH